MLRDVSVGMPGSPHRIGDYELRGLLGNGGMGVVYQAEHVTSHEAVALKTVRIPDPSYLSSIRREIQALSQLHHPGVVRILAEGVVEGIPWYAMELLHGRTFADLLRDAFPWPTAVNGSARTTVADDQPPTQAGHLRSIREGSHPGVRPNLAVNRPIAGGGRLLELLSAVARLCAPLAFLHGEGIVHRDLTPANVFLRPDGSVVVMDFGLVWRHAGGVGREVLESGMPLAGTIGFMSPEQIRGEVLDARTDLYSLGCILYKAVTGRMPFGGDDPAIVLQMTLTDLPTPPSQVCDGVPAALDELIVRLLAKRPRDRIGHAADVATALADLGADLGARPVAPEPTRAYLYRPELGGRDEVRSRLIDHIGHAVAASGSIVMLRGESGIGKTLVASDAARVARDAGMLVVTGECTPPGAVDTRAGRAQPTGGALHPLRSLLQVIADLCVEGGGALTEVLLGPRGKLLATFEPMLAGLPGQGLYSEPAFVAAKDVRHRLLDALADTLTALTHQTPVMLILDDLQWADELTLALLAGLRERFFVGRRLLVLVTCRSDEMTDEVRAIAARPDATSIELGRLDEATVASLVRDMLAMASPPRELVRFLAAESEGNPFFVAEYLRTAVSEALLYRDGRGEWQLREPAAGAPPGFPLPLPRSLAELIARRLDALGADALALVELAAVIGREIELDVLAAARGVADLLDLHGGMNALMQGQVLEDARPGSVRFLHDKLRETVLARIAPARRAELHRRVAEALEQHASGPGWFPRLAHHFGEASDTGKAIEYLEKAGEEALRASANREAARFFERALELDATSAQPVTALRRARWERQLGDACMLVGDQEACQRHLGRAVALLGWPVPTTTPQLVLSVARHTLRQTLHRLLPARFVGSRPAEVEVLLEAARAYHRLMQNRFFAGEALPIMDAMLRTLNLSELAGPSAELGLAYGSAHGVAYLVPMRKLAETYVQRAYATLARTPDPEAETWVRNLHAIYLLGIGAWAEARDCARRSGALAEPVGLRRRWEESRGILAHVELFCGDLAASARHFQEQLDSSVDRDPTVECWAVRGLAQVRLELDDPEGGRALAERAMGLLQHKLGKTEEAPIYGVLALAHLRLGDLDAARRYADRATEITRRGQPGAFWCIAPTSSVAEVYLDLAARSGRGDAGALRRAEVACGEVARTARIFPIAGPPAALRLGQLERLRGRRSQAMAAFARSARLAEALHMPRDLAVAQQEQKDTR